jgi:hypothetical protein
MINEPPDPSRIDEPPDPSQIDETHDPSRTSWVSSANDHPEFPIQNLPIGVFSPAGGAPRGGIAIGDAIFDIEAALNAGLFTGAAREVAEAAASRTLNALLEAAPRNCWMPRARRPEKRARPAGCCMTRQAAHCICRFTSATTPISSPASIMPTRAARSAARTIR